MGLPSWLLTLPLLTLPFGAAAQSGAWTDPSCRPIAARLIQQELDRAQASRPAALSRRRQATPEADSVWAPREAGGAWEEQRRATAPSRSAEAPATPSPESSASAAGLGDRSASFGDTGARGKASVAKDKADGRGPARYSRTNTQEEAVDEGDIVKTNGRYVFHVSCSRAGEASGCRDELRIFKSWPADKTQLVGRHRLGDGVHQIYLHGDRVVVLARAASARGARLDTAGLAPGRDFSVQMARVTMLDVTDPARPRALGDLDVEGELVESRMIGPRLFLATRSPRLQLPAALVREIHALAHGGVSDAETALDRIDARWSTFVNLDPGLPHLGNAARTAPIYGCADLTITDPSMDGQLLNVAQIDLGGEVRGAGLTGLTPAATLYASEGALYVASPGAIPANTGWTSATNVKKLTLTGGQPRFASQGTVRGTLLNQFSMSEHQGHLRVATTDQWTSNNVYVLRERERELETIGKLENLGRNERIYAVRMMGDRAYVVTFRRTDPLYTIDLSDPTRPTLLGELHIEGFSNYLHPLGGNHLLAIGQDADTSGRATGFHLQVFDVTDPRRPVRKFHHKLDAGSTSEAQADHHAFFFEPTTNTLSVPWKSEAYWGLIAFRVDPQQGFVDLGRVNHALMFKRHFRQVCARADVAECGRANHWWTFVTRPAIAVDRMVAIDDHLVSVSPAGLMVHRVGRRLTETTSVLVQKPEWSAAQARVARGW